MSKDTYSLVIRETVDGDSNLMYRINNNDITEDERSTLLKASKEPWMKPKVGHEALLETRILANLDSGHQSQLFQNLFGDRSLGDPGKWYKYCITNKSYDLDDWKVTNVYIFEDCQ